MMQVIDPEVVLESGHLRLEPILPRHAALLFESLQAPELYTFIPQNPPTCISTLEEKYLRWSRRSSIVGDEIWLNYALYDTSQATYIGTVQATIFLNQRTYIAYEVFPKFWHKRFATVACSKLIDFLFERYNVVEISALTDTRNSPSQRLLESLGFKRTETILAADEFKGSISDEFCYSLSNSAWVEHLSRR